MNLLKELRHVYKCDTLRELGRILKIPERTIYGWSSGDIPPDKRGMLEETFRLKKLENRQEEEEGKEDENI